MPKFLPLRRLLMLALVAGATTVTAIVASSGVSNAVTIPAGRPAMQLPFQNGSSWTLTCGYSCHPQDNWDRYAADFAPWPTTDRTIYAPIGGRVTVESTRQCWIRIESANGWFVNMMHTASALVPSGSTVAAGQRIGVMGAQSGGPCGVATGVHLHVSLMHRDSDGVSRSYPFGSMSCNPDSTFASGTRVVSWACAAPPSSTPAAIVIDDGGPGFSLGGPSAYWLQYANGYNRHMFATWNNGPCSFGSSVCPYGADVNFATWRPNLPSTRSYRVCAYIPEDHAYTTSARYVVGHAAGTSVVVVNQQPLVGWTSLGVFPFSAGTAGSVRLGDWTGEAFGSRQIGFDAVKFVPDGGACG
jgi:murein DD-endopeptidase MepM/ murein hydrolase activator NlpD